MKKLYNLMLLCAAVIFASCSDVPAPYDLNNEGGEIVETMPEGDGTIESPFNVAAANLYIDNGGDETATVYIKGIVYSIDQIDTSYGNGTFYISDDGKAQGKLEVYRAYSLGKEKFKSEDELKEGDEVIICGKLVNYNGTYEVTQGGYIYSLNGVTAGGGGNVVDAPKGSGTLADPYNATAANNYIATLAADQNSDNEIYVKGIVVSIKEAFGSYGNTTFYLADSKESANQFYAFRVLGLGNKKCTDPNALKEGDEVIVCGKVVNYKGNTPETVQGSSYIYSINGNTGDGGGTLDPGTTATPSGDGTANSPFNVAAAIAKAVETGQTATNEQYYIKGKVKEVNASGAAQYGNINIDMVDDGSNAVFKAFQVNGLNGEKFTAETAATIKVGDEIVVKGNIVNYMDNTPETTGKGAGCVVLINGKAEYGTGGGGTNPPAGDEITAASFGLDNAAPLGTLTLADGTTLTFAKNGGSTAPAFYTAAGGTFRIYPQNTITVSSSKKIESIVINCDEYNGTKYIAEGNVTCQPGYVALNGLVFTFSGINNNSCVVTNAETTTGGQSQMRIKSFSIKYAE